MIRRLGIFFMAVGLAFSIGGFVMLAQPDVPVRFNGVLTTSVKPKLFIALFPLIHVVVGAFLAFDLPRYWAARREQRWKARGSFSDVRMPHAPPPSPFLQKHGSLLIGVPMCLLFLTLGLWIIHMGWQGHTSAQELSRREVPAVMSMGVLFAWGGIQGVVLLIGGERLPKWGHAGLLSVFIVCLATPFLLAGILTPDRITSTASIGPLILEQEAAGRSGGYVFVALGVLLLVALPFIVRGVLSKGR